MYSSSQAVALVATAVGNMVEILRNQYAYTVQVDGFVRRQLEVELTGDDFWVGTRFYDSRGGRPDGETVNGKYFQPSQLEDAVAFGKEGARWVLTGANAELGGKRKCRI